MEQFRAYSPEDIILSNLEEASARHTCIFEQELAHLSELARELIESQADESEMLSALPDFRLPDAPITQRAQSITGGEILQRLARIHTAEKRFLLCDAIRKLLRSHPRELYSDGKNVDLHVENRIAYQKSSFTDLAFLCFSSLLEAPRATYTHSFLSACEDVYNNAVDYCILPVENTTEGRLVGFTKLIDRFGLRIIATCDVAGNEGTRSTCFALLSKNISYPRADFGERFLEIAVPQTEAPTVTQILLASELCGLLLCRIDSLPPTDGSTDRLYHAVFRAGDESLSTFLLYLAMEIPQYNLVGIYTHLSHS